jgi:serine/threonine protein kinase/tetratricopeptide (TPR) repeat protein
MMRAFDPEVSVTDRPRPSVGPFTLLAPLGRGAMGEVWRGEHTATGAPVAVKLLRDLRQATHAELEVFRQEVRAVAALDHPNVVALYDHGRVGAHDAAHPEAPGQGTPYIVMELARGRSLAELPGTLPWPQVRDVALGVLDALAHAHARGVFHRDLKPGNVITRAAGSTREVVVGDFGLAWALSAPGHDLEAPALGAHGTPGFMATEQIQGRWRDIGPWTDVYAVGALVWRLVCGAHPFDSAPTTDAVLRAQLAGKRDPFRPRGAVPPGLRAWLEATLAPDMTRRYAFAAQAAHHLRRLDGLAPATRPVRPHRLHPPGVGLDLFPLRPVPLVGRELELGELELALDEARRTGTARAVLIKGAAGMGKTHLAHELSRRAHARGHAITLSTVHEPDARADEGVRRLLSYHLRCDGLDRDGTRSRIRHVLETLERPGDSPDELDEDVEALVEALHPRAPLSFAAVVASVLRGQGPRAVAMTRMVRRLSRIWPIVLLFDDAQWGTEALGFAAHTLAHHADQRLLFVLTVRDDASANASSNAARLLDAISRHPSARTLELGPLSPLSHSALITRLLPMDAELARAVESSTAGNPLFAVQVVSDCVRREVLEPGPGGWRLREGAELALPADIQELWTRELAGALATLPTRERDAARRCVELGALLGEEVAAREWELACAHAGTPPPERLVDALLERRLASPTPHGWAFFHGSLRASVLERAGDLTWAHAACAHALRALGARASDAERLARHELGAAHPADALSPLLTAAEWRHARGDFDRARELHDQWAATADAVGLGAHDPQRIAGLLCLAKLHIATGDLLHASHVAKDAVSLAEQTQDEALVAHAYVVSSGIARKQGRFAEVAAPLERARVIYDAHGDARGVGFCDLSLGELYETMGRHAEADALLREAALRFERIGNRDDLSRALMVLGSSRYNQGDTAGGDEYTREAMRLFAALGNTIGQSFCLNIQGEGARRAGDLERAADHYKSASYILKRLGSHEYVFPEFNLLLIHLLRGEFDTVGEAARGLVDALRELDRPAYLGLALLMCACHDAHAREWAAWDDHFGEGAGLVSATGLIELDAALIYEQLAALTRASGQGARGERAWALALAQRAALDAGDAPPAAKA